MTEGKRDARQAIEDLELDKHLAQAGAAAAKLAQDAVSAAGGFADAHREQAHEWLGHAEGEIDTVDYVEAGTHVVARVGAALAAEIEGAAAGVTVSGSSMTRSVPFSQVTRRGAGVLMLRSMRCSALPPRHR